MNKIYKEACRCYRNNEFSDMRIEVGEDGMACVYSKKREVLQVFVNRTSAEKELEKQCDKARKRILEKR